MTREDYLKYASSITERLDNTNEYSLWLAIQCYVDEMYLALECAKVGLKKEKSTKEKSLQALNEIREYAIKEKEFNDNQISEYKTCIETNENGKFNDEEKENFEHCMTVNICINYKMNDILQIIDKVGDEK